MSATDPYADLLIDVEEPPDLREGAPVPASSWPTVAQPGTVPVEVITARRRPCDGAELLDSIEHFVGRFVAYPGEPERVAHVLWIAHTWFMDVWESTPRIAFLSPEPGSGKSRALEVTEPLVPRAIHAVNMSAAALFRSVSAEGGQPTLLYDEIDTVFGPKAKDNEDIRGLLNAGHRKGAYTLRCVVKGKAIELEEFPAYCAVALAGLNDLPDTIMTRSVVVRMRRRAPGEYVEPWRMRTTGAEGHDLGERIAEWAGRTSHLLGDAWPELPPSVEDRNADVWEALVAVADLAGGVWPERARRSAVALVAQSQDRAESLGVLLLRDLRTIFVEAAESRLSTEHILTCLLELDESPWGDLRGKPLDARGLSRRLAKYDVKPRNLRIAGAVLKGYDAADLTDPWSRYLPSGPENEGQRDTPPPYLEDGVAESWAPRQESATAATPLRPGTCQACGEPMLDLGDGATTHPGCEQVA